MTKVQLELGGKDPVYVCEDVDVKTAAAGIADGAFYNTGQSCCSVERIYVHESIHDAFVAAFVAEVKGFKMGDPMDESTYIGAITRRPQLDVLKKQVADAKKKGAKLLTGGSVVRGKGNWFEPTVFVGRRSLDGVDEGRELRPDHRHRGRRRRRGGGRPHERHRLRPDRRRVHDRSQARAEDSRAGAMPAASTGTAATASARGCRGRASAIRGSASRCPRYGIQTFTRPKAWHLRSP